MFRDTINPTSSADRRRFARSVVGRVGGGAPEELWIEQRIVPASDEADRISVKRAEELRVTRAAQLAALPRYAATDSGLVWNRSTADGVSQVPLTNFIAQIVGESELDDGVEIRRVLEMEAKYAERTHRFSIPAANLDNISWVTEQLGATAIVWPPFSNRDHVRAAIQYLSGNVAQRTVYTHVGWRSLGGEWVYLHAGGAIGTVGTVAGVQAHLEGSLAKYELPTLSSLTDVIPAVTASLDLLSVDDALLVAVAGAYRSVLGATDLSIHLVGASGCGKSERAALAQQHFGAGMDRLHLPGNWSSTGNALEMLAFGAKDALLVVDDFAPTGSPQDVLRYHREAARLLRAQGNAQGRGRLSHDGSLRPQKPPRGLILSTGEDKPRDYSIRARSVIVNCEQQNPEWWDCLGRFQQLASQGVYALALAGFVRWLAPGYGKEAPRHSQRIAALREGWGGGPQSHKRTPSNVAELIYGLERFLTFAVDCGALSDEAAEALSREFETRLLALAAAQIEHQQAAEPGLRFLELLRSAVVSGRAHVVSSVGEAPLNPGVWGWRAETRDSAWHPCGDQVGWVEGKHLFLEPQTAYRVAQAADGGGDGGLSISSSELWKRLREKGRLASTDERRRRLTVRRTLQGVRRDVLHLRAASLMPTPPSIEKRPNRPICPARELELTAN